MFTKPAAAQNHIRYTNGIPSMGPDPHDPDPISNMRSGGGCSSAGTPGPMISTRDLALLGKRAEAKPDLHIGGKLAIGGKPLTAADVTAMAAGT